MSPAEAQFLKIMTRMYERMEEHKDPDSTKYSYRAAPYAMAKMIQDSLKAAGKELVLRPRFSVVPMSDRTFLISPLNGQAERMMMRYKQLYLESELSRC